MCLNLEWRWTQTCPSFPLVVSCGITSVPFTVKSCPNQNHQDNIGTVFPLITQITCFRSLEIKELCHLHIGCKEMFVCVTGCVFKRWTAWFLNNFSSWTNKAEVYLINITTPDVYQVTLWKKVQFCSSRPDHGIVIPGGGGVGGGGKNRPAAGMKSSQSVSFPKVTAARETFDEISLVFPALLTQRRINLLDIVFVVLTDK